MDQIRQQWTTWLETIPLEQRTVLADILKTSTSNGHAAAYDPNQTPPQHQVTVTRSPTQDLYVTEPPVYVDTLRLHDVYKRIAFDSNLLLKGPKGDGKTLSIISFAAETRVPIVIQECSEDTKSYNLMGSQSLIGTETIYVLGSIPTAIDVANEVGNCILLFEELNALTPQVQKQLNAVTDFRKMVSMPHIGKTYRLRKDAYIWVVGTMNPSVYGGTYDLNEDLKSRFEEIEVTYPSTEAEKQILKRVCVGTSAVDDKTLDMLLRFARETRQQATGYSLSTRDLVRLVQTVAKVGLPTAIQMVVCKFEGEDRDTVMKRLGSVFGTGVVVKKYWGGA
jgi:MoxR-like ATPase